MHRRIGARSVMADDALSGHFGQGIVQIVGALAVRPLVAGQGGAVRRIVMAGGAVRGLQGACSLVAALAGQAHAALGGAQQIGTVTERAGVFHISGGFMAVGGRSHPVGIGMRGPGGMAVFTAVGQVSQGDVKTRITARTAVEGRRVALLAVGQVGLGFGPMQRR